MVTYDDVPVLAAFSDANGIGYPLVSDGRREIVPAFGVGDERYGRTSPWHGVARPIIFVVDASGIVRHRFSGPDYQSRPDVDAVLAALKREAGG